MSVVPSPHDPAARLRHSIQDDGDNQPLLSDEYGGPAAALSGARILLADDDPVMREYARLLLVEHGAQVDLACDGAQALAAIRSDPPDLALLDLVMPQCTGIEVIEAVRADEALRTLPLVMLSGQTSEDAKLDGFRAGADDYLTKPYSERELLARVGGQLAMSRMRNAIIERERQLRAEADLLNEVALEVTSELELQSLVQRVTDIGTRLTGAMFGAFFRSVDGASGEHFEIYAVSGNERDIHLRLPQVAELLAPTFRGEGVVRLEDVTRDRRYGINAPYGGLPDGDLTVRSCLAVPVIVQNRKVIGALLFGHPEAGKFGARAERFAQGIAAQAAVAMDNARLYARARDEVAERTRAEKALRQSQEQYAQLVQALKRSEQQLRLVIDALPAMVSYIDSETRYRFFNRQLKQWFGLDPEQLEGRTMAQVMGEQAYDVIRPHVERVLSGEMVRFQMEMPGRNGDMCTVEVTYAPDVAPDGRVEGFIGLLNDITDRITAERSLRDSEERFRSLAMNAPAGIYIKDLDGTYRLANPLACAWLGREDVVNLSDHDLMPQEWADKLREHDLKVIVTGEPLQTEEKLSVAGVTHEFLSAKFPLLNAEGHPTGVCGVSVDITARKRAENALRYTIERTKLIAGVSEQLLSANDPLTVVKRLCDRVAEFLNCDFFSVRLVNEKTGRLDLKAFEGIPDAERPSVESTQIGSSMSGNAVRDGRPRIVAHIQRSTEPERARARELGLQAYACHPLQVAGHIIGTLSFASRNRPEFTADDVDLMKTVADQVAIAMERLSARQALLDVNVTLEERVRERTMELVDQRRHLQRLAAELTTAEQRERKRLASLLHDDLQQLLVSAKMLMGTLERRRDDPDDLLATCRRVQELIDDSIASARDMSRQLRPPVLYEDGLVPALRWLASEMRRIHGLRIDVSAAEDVEPADDDQRAFLFECVRELLLNIVKHAGVQEAFIEARRSDGNTLQLIVRDEGRGFELAPGPLARHNEGFGLFSIRERLASIGGRIDIQSAPGMGTTTTIDAPMVESAAVGPALDRDFYREVRRRVQDQETRVLVVDDHALVREGIATMIDEDGDFCVVGQASDGLEAIEAVETHHPEIVLMDLNMPRMNGIEATRVIRRQWPGIIIVGLSVQEDDTTARSVMEAGASIFLSKSSTPDQIMTTMRSLVAQHQDHS